MKYILMKYVYVGILGDMPLYCIEEVIKILGYAVYSLYPNRESNDTIIEVNNI